MKIAFFDLDRTLISINSANAWVRRELALGHLSLWDATRAAIWLVRYHFGFVDLEAAVEETIRSMAGTREDALRERVDAFYEETIRHLYRPGASAALKAHRARGDRLVLLTSASCYLADTVARDLGFDDVLSNHFEVDENGVFVGRSRGDLCFGAGKLTIARRYAEAQQVSLRDCTFYTDSMADAPLLEAIGEPVAVNPDPRLARLAKSRNWPIADWGVV